jgi:hypothetical protein
MGIDRRREECLVTLHVLVRLFQTREEIAQVRVSAKVTRATQAHEYAQGVIVL